MEIIYGFIEFERLKRKNIKERVIMAKTIMQCPECKRRDFDIFELPDKRKSQVEVELKCPQCKKLVRIPCTKEFKYNQEQGQ